MALGQPRFVDRPAFTVAGLRRTYTPATVSEFVTQWTEMKSRLQFVTGRVGGDAFGLWFDVLKGREFSYLTGVQVGEFAPLSFHFDAATVAAQHYAVFTHDGDANSVRTTIDGALKWLPQSGREMAQLPNAPDFFERYSEEFNNTGKGPIEVWLAVKR